jgi:hypothetical protein
VTFVGQSTWLGYGTGAYYFQSQSYFVLFNDPYDGSSKPNIHVNPSFAPNMRISLVEFSDWTSYVDGYNLFNDFNVTIRTLPATNNKVLDVTYTRPGLVVHKLIDASAAGHVVVRLEASREVVAHIEMWKWLMSSVNGVVGRVGSKPRIIPISTSVNFTFVDQILHMPGAGLIKLSRVPTQIEVWPFEDGFNRVTVDFVNSEMEFSVSGYLELVGVQWGFPEWGYAVLPYVMPLVAIVAVSLYLLVVRHGEKDKGRYRRARR